MFSTVAGTLFALILFFQSTIATNHPTLVNLRIEGADKTIFEGRIVTRGHNVTTAEGGNHHCDGTNNNQNPSPGPTCTSALDDAARRHGFSWDGYDFFLFQGLVIYVLYCRAYFAEFDDYLVDTIGGDSSTATEFWGLLLNFEFTQVGGCQQQVKEHDHILWAFDAFSKSHFLKLEGPRTARQGQAVTYTVTDGATGNPVAGADVHGGTTDANGHVSVTFAKAGENGIKATESDSIRSNQIDVLVFP
jgi:hypothetical protein